MTPMKSSLRNVSPRPESARYKELRESRSEKRHVNKVREKIREWPEELQDMLNKIEGEVDENNELKNLFEDLDELKSVVEDSEEYVMHVVQCFDYLLANAPYLLEDYYQPECTNVTELSSNISVNTNGSNLLYVGGLLLGVLLPLLASYFFWQGISPNTPDNAEIYKIDEWTQNIKDLQKDFPSQNEKIWFSIVSGVKTIVTEEPTKPSVLLLLHNDKKTSACLANQVGKKAVKLLSNTLQEPIIIQGEELKLNDSLTKDYGLFTESYKRDIEKIHVMIVHDLQEVPAMIARTFHVLCDVENPLVRNAAFLFTMQVDEKEKKNPTEIAEEYLGQLWRGTLSDDVVDPLITRITDAVELVKMESALPC